MEDFKLGTDLCTFPASRPWTVSSSIFLLTSFIHSASRCRRPSSWHSGCGAGSLLLLTTLLSPYVPGILQFLNNSPSSLIGLILLNSRMHQQPEMDLPRYIVLDLTAQTTGLAETPAKTLPHVVFPLVLRITSLTFKSLGSCPTLRRAKLSQPQLNHNWTWVWGDNRIVIDGWGFSCLILHTKILTSCVWAVPYSGETLLWGQTNIVTTPTQPQLNLFWVWHEFSNEFARLREGLKRK